VVPAPLDDIRVIESSNWVAAPSAGAILADLGADVIKIEPLRGDAMRGMFRPARSADGNSTIDTGFHVDNRGKRSIAIAVDQPEGADLVKRLISSAHIFSTNLLPERQVRYGLDPETIFKVNPRIVHATMSGFGLVGPDATRPGFDVTAFFGRGSIIESMTDPHESAPYPRPGQGDHVAGLAFLSAILAGLRLAERTGQGQVVDANLFSSATWTMATDLSAVLVDGRAPTKRDRHHAVSALANRYRCADDRWLVLNMPDAAWWVKFCAFAQREELIDDPRFSTPKERHDNMPALVDIFDEIFARRTLAEWSTLLDDAKLIWGPASSVTELAQDPQASAIGLFPEIEFREQPMRTVAAPLNIRGADVRPRGAGPSVGQHTVEILTSIGLDRAEIDALSAANVVLVPRES
jgi:crotonobetainyl-CoA:carnitine CoA-transferase CaiB-like acyl-CoA transferase